MNTITLDKFTEEIISLRDQIEAADPGAASRIHVFSLTGRAGTQLTPDSAYPALNNLQGPHYHQQNETEGGHGPSAITHDWPECIIIQ